jgi:hypothetical protein
VEIHPKIREMIESGWFIDFDPAYFRPVFWWGKDMQERKIDPRILEAAKDDGILRHMIRAGVPLTREKWLSMNYLGHPPQPWTSEHEAEVPEPFRRPLHDD